MTLSTWSARAAANSSASACAPQRSSDPVSSSSRIRFGAFAAARLTRLDDVDAVGTDGVGEGDDLGRLADPLPAFEADEFPAVAHAIPMSDLRPSQMRPKKPALPTSSPATSGTTCGGVSGVVMTRSAICCALGDRRHHRALVADLHAGRAARQARPGR